MTEQRASGFIPSTHWSLLNAMREGGHTERDAALSRLVERYQRPTYAHIRAKEISHADAEDLVQSFFERWWAHNPFSSANPSRGRFRNLFLTSLNNFLISEYRKSKARKRSPIGGISDVEIETLASPDSPHSSFDGAFDQQLIRAVLRDLEEESCHSGKLMHYEIFYSRVVEPALDGLTPPILGELARRFRITEKQASNCVVTMKRAFRRLLKDQIRQYALSQDDFEQEVIRITSSGDFDV